MNTGSPYITSAKGHFNILLTTHIHASKADLTILDVCLEP